MQPQLEILMLWGPDLLTGGTQAGGRREAPTRAYDTDYRPLLRTSERSAVLPRPSTWYFSVAESAYVTMPALV